MRVKSPPVPNHYLQTARGCKIPYMSFVYPNFDCNIMQHGHLCYILQLALSDNITFSELKTDFININYFQVYNSSS